MGLRNVVREIHRRSVWQVLAIYLASAFVAYSAIEALVSGLGLPEWFPGFAFILFIIGLPIVLATAIVQEGGPARGRQIDPTLIPGAALDEAPATSAALDDDSRAVRLLTWRNAIGGGVLAMALWGVVATGWMLLLDGAPAPASASSERQKLVVLPFENLGAPEDDYFADGLTEEVISRLAEIPELGVISRTSALQYKGTEKSIGEIGEELDVQYVLEGTVRWERPPEGASRVRVTPQLIRVSDDTHLWTERYDAVLASVFDIQSDIAGSVATAMGVALLDRGRPSSDRPPTTNLDAYQYLLRGNDHMHRGFSETDSRAAVEMYEKAVELDPTFAEAHARLSRAHSRMYWFFFDRSDERMAAALRAAERALELDPDHPQGHIALGSYYYRLLDYDRALAEFATAERLLPSSGDLAYTISTSLRRKGDWEKGLEYLRRAVELDPRSSETAHALGSTLYYMRDYSETQASLDRSILLQADWPQPRVYKAWVQLSADGDAETARSTLQRAIDVVSPESLFPGVDDVQPWYMLRSVGPPEWVEGLAKGIFGADTASYFLARAELYGQRGEEELGRAYFDSVRVLMESNVARRPDDARFRSLLGVAYAGLGRKDDAIREANRATELLSVEVDGLWGRTFHENLAWVYVTAGEHDAAIDELQYLLSIPGPTTPALLRIDPAWEPLRDSPRFWDLLD